MSACKLAISISVSLNCKRDFSLGNNSEVMLSYKSGALCSVCCRVNSEATDQIVNLILREMGNNSRNPLTSVY
jgi:hypothetical protein